MLEALVDVTERDEVRADAQVPLRLERGILLSLGELEEPPPDREALVEVAAVQVEAGEAPQQGKGIRGHAGLVELGQRIRVDVLDLLGVSADRHEPAREARPHRDLLGGALRRRRRRREHGEQVVRELDRSVVPAAVVVQRPERVEHRVESPEVAGSTQ